jgi:hypothetical protein
MRKPVFNHLTKVETFVKSHDDAVFAADRRLAMRFATLLRKHLSQFNLQNHYVRVWGEDDYTHASIAVYPNHQKDIAVFVARVSDSGALRYEFIDKYGDPQPLPHRKYKLRAVMYDLLRALAQVDPRALAHISGETVG